MSFERSRIVPLSVATRESGFTTDELVALLELFHEEVLTDGSRDFVTIERFRSIGQSLLDVAERLEADAINPYRAA